MRFPKRKSTPRFSKKTGRTEKLEKKNELITALTKLSGKNLGLVASFEPSIADGVRQRFVQDCIIATDRVMTLNL